MPPPKKPKDKASWKEFMWLMGEGEHTSAGGQPPTCCRSESMVSNGTDFDVFECSEVPEDLSLKSGGYRTGCQIISSSELQMAHPDFNKEMHCRTIGEEHPRLRNILLGVANQRISSEAPEITGSQRSVCNSEEKFCSYDRKPLTSAQSPCSHSTEYLPQVALPIYSDTRMTRCPADVLVSDAEGCDELLHKASTQNEKVRYERETSILSQSSGSFYTVGDVESQESHRKLAVDAFNEALGCRLTEGVVRKHPGRSYQPEGGGFGAQILADSTTNPAVDRLETDCINARHHLDRSSGCYLKMLAHEVPWQEQRLKADPGCVLTTMRTATREGDRMDTLSAKNGLSNIKNHQKVGSPYAKRSLKMLLLEEVAPPSEDDGYQHSGSGATKRMRTKASEVSSMAYFTVRGLSESQESEKTGIQSTDYSSSPELPSSSCGEMVIGKTTDDKGVCRCQICNDVASGFHYGVWSCEGCKAFFKRSLHGPVDYICPSTDNCTIDKLRRKSCQACRLRKCREAGMTAGTTRKEKGLRTVGRKRKSSDFETNNSETEPVRRDDVGSSHCASSVQRLCPENGASKDANHAQLSHSNTTPNQRPGNKGTAETNSLIDRLLAIEFPPRLTEFDQSMADSKLQLLSGLLGLINRQLIDIIMWSKSLPGFSQSSLELRTQLLVGSWSELVILGTVWQSLPHPDVWVCAPNLHLTRARCQATPVEPLFTQAMALVGNFRRLQPTQAELVLLRLTILLNSNVAAIENEASLASLQSMLDEAWQQVSTDRPARNRVTRLLLTLPDVRQCSLIMRDLVRSVRRHDGIPAFDLLHEVLDMDRDFADARLSVSESIGAE